MPLIAIPFFSGTGTTTRVAEAIASGVGADAALMPIDGKQIIDGRFKDEAFLAKLDGAATIVFGSPTYMGGPAGQFKAFADATAGRWFKRAWSGKFAGGFSASGSPSGDKLSTLQYLSLLASQHGMLWVGQDQLNGVYQGQPADTALNALGSHLGVMAQQTNQTGGAISAGDTATAKAYGARISAIVAKMR
jgi:NAD(P)H dehydrogenase (quinone)